MHKARHLLVFLFLFITGFCYADQLVFAVDIIRHGDRTPTKDISSPPYAWPEGLGELTPGGAQQEVVLGEQLRKTYVDQYHLLPAAYKVSNLDVRASNFNRTIKSAQAFLSGLYPGASIGIESQGQDQLFVAISDTEKKALLNQYVFSQADWQDENAKLAPNYAKWSKATGFQIHTLYELIPVGDALYIRQLHHVPLPAGLSLEDVNTIINAEQWAVAAQFKPKELGSAFAKNILLLINQDLTAASKQGSTLKYLLLSGHDSTILSVLSTLSVPQDKEVPYASDLQLMMFVNAAHQYYLIVNFNGIPLKLPACHDNNHCSLAEFSSL